jgi:hypothetical protein
MRVIGGAGGKLNMLKLRGVKSEGEYKGSAAANQAAKRKARKDMIASDKALGLHEAKEKARAELFEQTRKARQTFVRTVAQTMGWDASALALDTSELSPDAAKKAQRRHKAELLKKAGAAVDLPCVELVACFVTGGQFADDPFRLLRIGIDHLLLERVKVLIENYPAGLLHRFLVEDVGHRYDRGQRHERGDESVRHDVARAPVLQEIFERPSQLSPFGLGWVIDERQDR